MQYPRFTMPLASSSVGALLTLVFASLNDASAHPPEHLALACEACADKENWEHEGDSGGDGSDVDEEACATFDELSEGDSAPVALYFENRLMPNEPAYELVCSGYVELSCRNPPPFVCGANILGYFQTTDERRPVLVAVSTEPMLLTLGDQQVELVAACPPAANKAKRGACRHFEGRLAVDVRDAADRFRTGSISGPGAWTQTFKLTGRDGALVARGEIELSEFQDVVGMLGLWQRAPGAADLNRDVVLVVDQTTPVASLPESGDVPVIAAKHVMRLKLPALPAGAACVAGNDPAAPNGTLSHAIEGLALEIFDRETGRVRETVPLAGLPRDTPCSSRYLSLGANWVLPAYRDAVVAQAARLMGPSAGTPAPTSAGLRMPLGLSAPTLDALLNRVKGVRTQLGMLLSHAVTGLRITTKMFDIETISMSSGIDVKRLTAMGLDPTFAEMVGGPATTLEKLLGAPAKREKSTTPAGERWEWDPVPAKLGMGLRAVISDKGSIISLEFKRK